MALIYEFLEPIDCWTKWDFVCKFARNRQLIIWSKYSLPSCHKSKVSFETEISQQGSDQSIRKVRKKSFAWYFVFHMCLKIRVMLDILFHILFHIVLNIVRFICGWIRPGQRGWPAPARSKSCDNSVCWPAAATAVDVEFVKSFKPVRFPNFSILPEKTRKSRHFGPTNSVGLRLLLSMC